MKQCQQRGEFEGAGGCPIFFFRKKVMINALHAHAATLYINITTYLKPLSKQNPNLEFISQGNHSTPSGISPSCDPQAHRRHNVPPQTPVFRTSFLIPLISCSSLMSQADTPRRNCPARALQWVVMIRRKVISGRVMIFLARALESGSNDTAEGHELSSNHF